jgi:hypothetical protein
MLLNRSAVMERRYDYLESAASAVAKSPAADPGVRRCAELILAYRDDRVHSLAMGDSRRLTLAQVRDWRVIGPFDNVSKSGLDNPFAPEQRIDFDAPVQGKDDLVLKWRRCPIVNRDGACQVSTFIGDPQPDVYYAATAVCVPKAQNVHIRMGVNGACKLFVNGIEVLRDDVYRQMDTNMPDTFDVPVSLKYVAFRRAFNAEADRKIVLKK